MICAQAKYYDYKVMQGSCGSIIGLLDDLIEIGLDGIHPSRVTAKGMEPRALTWDFGLRLSFAGSIDAMRTLITGTRRSRRRCVIESRCWARAADSCLALHRVVHAGDTGREHCLMYNAR
jgi:hypothetical protein